MFGTLIESRARRQRRSGGAALSVATHVAIVGMLGAFSVPREAPAHKPVDVFPVQIPREPARRPEPHAPDGGARRRDALTVPIDVPVRLPAPVFGPELPAIDLARGPSIDSLLRAAASSAGAAAPGGRLDLTSDAPGDGSGEWRGSELLMRIVTSATPRYPESLRHAGIGGRVLVRFTVDTLGRIDPASVTIISATHESFARAVREVLPAFRFRPAKAGGHRVAALAKMPFEFNIQP